MKSRIKYDMRGCRVLVTGAGSGIGRSTAIALGRAGAKVALLSRSADELLKVAAEMGGGDEDHLILTADVSESR